MKRVYLCLVLFGISLFISGYCMNELAGIQKGMDSHVAQIVLAAESGDMAKAYELTNTLQEYWEECEYKLMKYVRHNDLDLISMSVSRLPYLAKYGDLTELLSEANIVRKLMYHVWDSERLLLRNII